MPPGPCRLKFTPLPLHAVAVSPQHEQPSQACPDIQGRGPASDTYICSPWFGQAKDPGSPNRVRHEKKDGIFRTSKGYCSAPELTVPNILSRCCRRCRRRRPRTAEAPRAALQSLHGSVYNGTSQRIRSRKFFQFSAGAPAPTGPPQLRLLRFGQSWREEAGFAETGAGRKGATPQGRQAHRAHGGICETV